MEHSYTVVLREEPEGGFTVLVPALEEIVSYGKSMEEARRRATEAIECAILGREDRGEPVPEEGEMVVLPDVEIHGDLHIFRVTVAPTEEALTHA
jgi:predicted RNase H-like HicB family nuclease